MESDDKLVGLKGLLHLHASTLSLFLVDDAHTI